MKKELIMISTLLGILMISGQASAADDWTMFHHDLGLTGYSTSSAPNTNGTLWTYQTGADVMSSPAIVDGVVYIGSNDKNVYALDLYTGSKIWNYTTDGLVYSSPAVFGGKVFVGTTKGTFYSLDASTGTKIWSYKTGGIWGGPAVHNGKVFVNSYGGAYAFDVNGCADGTDDGLVTGECTDLSPTSTQGDVIWHSNIGGNSHVTVANGKIYIGTHGNTWSSPTLVALNESTGAIVWRYVGPGMVNHNGAAVASGTVYIGLTTWPDYVAGPGYVVALPENDPNNDGTISAGEVKWMYTATMDPGDVLIPPSPTGAGIITSSPAVHNDRIFIGSDNRKLIVLDATPEDGIDEGFPDPVGATYDLIWTYKTWNSIWSAPAVADGKVFVGSNDHIFYALNEITGALIWKYNTSTSRIRPSPGISDGIVVVGNENGKVYAFGPIPATIDIGPDTLNLKSHCCHENWITTYIEMPDGYNVEDIDCSSILLEGEISPDSCDRPTESVVGDYDNDGIPDLMVKFDRGDVIDLVKALNLDLPAEVELSVTGSLTDGTQFEGSDTIRVIENGMHKNRHRGHR